MRMSSEHEQEIMAWRSGRVQRLQAPDGWLSLVGKTFLEREGEYRVGTQAHDEVQLPEGSVPDLGRLIRRGHSVHFRPSAGTGVSVGVLRAGQGSLEAISGEIELASDQRGPADRLIVGTLTLEIMRRGDSIAARVRDTQSEARRTFAGIDYFSIRADWRVTARLVPYQPERRIELLYETGSTEAYDSPGAAVFQRDGVEYRLDPVFEQDRSRLYILFGDLTNRDSSYGAGRFLYTALPRDGHVLLDFNQAFSPPCAFTPFATCPIVPGQNRLSLRVEAGEKRPR
jgi:uncharacterized protein (DUF1684 family)